MILKREIEKQAEASGVLKSTIDKDWALGHFVDAIFSIDECRRNLIFKGGTCLRKCYFPDYRFSEDLDFTSTNSDFVLDEKLLKKIVSLIHERTGMHLYIDKIEPLRFEDKLVGYRAIIRFWGSEHLANQEAPEPKRWTTSIKIEITLFEKMLFQPLKKPVHHPYSDTLSEFAKDVPCYSLYEVIAEKLRAIIQRSYTAPRDFYDIWYLYRNISDIDWSIIREAFLKKMEFKGLAFEGIHQMINEQNDKRLITAWKSSLAHQIKPDTLPTYPDVKENISQLLKVIFPE